MPALLPARGLRRGPARRPRAVVDPLEVLPMMQGEQVETPDPIEWVLSDKFLDRPILYPRQATILKVIFLRDDMLTQYDHDVLGEWGELFARSGDEGCQPDVLDRIKICKEQGRPWFREVVNVLGRRGGKGHIGGICGSYVLWHYMHRPGGPQHYYGIDRDKRLTAIVFAGKKEQALANQWRDLTNVIVGAPCFAPYVSRPQAQRLTVYAPTDMIRAQRQELLGVEMESDLASFEIVPRESTLMAGRGPTSFMQFYDEMAHVIATGANRSAEEVYGAATPSLDQFGMDGFLYEGSSPWQMTGQFYENWQRSIAKEPDGRPSFPEMVMFQLPSWGPYQDWQEADRIPIQPPRKTYIEVTVQALTPTGERLPMVAQVAALEPAPTLNPLKRAVQEYDDQMRQLEKANPDTFKVERRSKWAAVLDAYLDYERVLTIFEPWNGRVLTETRRGQLSVAYKAHGDPAKVNDRFGFAIAHVEVGPDGKDHVVFDVLTKWEASQWPDRRIDYDDVESDLWYYIEHFQPHEMTFDQFASPGTVGRLNKKAHKAGLPKRTDVYEKTATETLNWIRFECFKVAMNMGLIHAPRLDLDGDTNDAAEIAELELRFLQRTGKRVDHPSSGPVQSKDVADCMVECVFALIGEQMANLIGEDLSALGVRPTMQRGMVSPNPQSPRAQADEVASSLAAVTSRGRAGIVASSVPARQAPGRRGGWGK